MKYSRYNADSGALRGKHPAEHDGYMSVKSEPRFRYSELQGETWKYEVP